MITIYAVNPELSLTEIYYCHQQKDYFSAADGCPFIGHFNDLFLSNLSCIILLSL